MKTESDLGTVTREDGTYVLRYERRLQHPREKVWRAITESEHLAHWMPCDIVGDRVAGGEITLPFWPGHVERYKIATPVLDGKISVWDPPAVFEWWWATDRLRWELEEVDETTTVLRFTTWLYDTDSSTTGTAAGYHVCLDRLIVLLDGGAMPSFDESDADSGAAEERYKAIIGE